MSKASRSRAAETTAHVDLEYPSSVPTFTVNPTQLSSSSSSPLPWFSAFGRKDANAPLPSEVDPKYSDPAYYASASTYGKNGRNSSHTAKKPEGHIKRPPNCFLLFRSHVKESGIRIPDALKPIIKDKLREKRREEKARKSGGAVDEDDEDEEDEDDDNDDDEQSVSKISGILWDFLPAAEKSFFRARAAHAKAMHKKLYPNYKYSPQVKDKTVKRRVGKKMASEKRARLEEVATVLVREMGWADGEINIKQRSATPATKQEPNQDINVPGTSAFGIPGYAHDKPARMERRTSSCPPPNANLTWADAAAAAASGHPHTPPASYGQMYHAAPPSHPQWGYAPPPPQPQPAYNPPQPGHSYVRPGGKTMRKMRTGPATAKAQALNGPGKKGKAATYSESPVPSSGGMTLPSLPAIMKAAGSEVPMSTGTAHFEAPAPLNMDGAATWTMGAYDQHSQHSSPQTFSSSAPPSVLLETPPFPHPQLQYQPPAFDQSYDFPGAQTQQFEGYQLSPMPPAQQAAYTYPAQAPVDTKPAEGELGLTIIDQHYTFPPSAPSPTGSPRSGSPPKAPSQRESKWTKHHQHSPLGTVEQRKVARLATRSPPRRNNTTDEPFTPSSASTTGPALLSPTPVTPVSAHSLAHPQAQQYDCAVEELGVELNLSSLPSGAHGEIEVDASMIGGFHFPGHYADGGYGLLGGANSGIVLSMPGEEQQYAAYEQYNALGPLDVPLQALYGGDESGPVVLENFDPSTYIADDLNAAAAVDEMKMASSQQLEYEMMEWRRGSGGSTATIQPTPQQLDDGRRASVSLGMALGSEVGMALYGYDAASNAASDATPRAYDATSPYGQQAIGDFEFQQAPAPHPHYQHMHHGHEFAMYPPPLGTVPEERERSSSEEAAEQRPALRGNGSWVASSA